MNEMQMYADAGKAREVHLDTLLCLIPEETTKRIVSHLKMSGLMASVGIDEVNPCDALMARIAAYMGWIEYPAKKPAERGAKAKEV